MPVSSWGSRDEWAGAFLGGFLGGMAGGLPLGALTGDPVWIGLGSGLGAGIGTTLVPRLEGMLRRRRDRDRRGPTGEIRE